MNTANSKEKQLRNAHFGIVIAAMLLIIGAAVTMDLYIWVKDASPISKALTTVEGISRFTCGHLPSKQHVVIDTAVYRSDYCTECGMPAVTTEQELKLVQESEIPEEYIRVLRLCDVKLCDTNFSMAPEARSLTESAFCARHGTELNIVSPLGQTYRYLYNSSFKQAFLLVLFLIVFWFIIVSVFCWLLSMAPDSDHLLSILVRMGNEDHYI